MENNEEILDQWVTKLYNSLTEVSLKLWYAWRNKFLHSSAPLFDHGILALKFLIKSLPLFCEEAGVLLFECLIYTFEIITYSMKQKPEQMQILAIQDVYTELYIECMTTALATYDFDWKETVQSFWTPELIFEFLAVMPCVPKVI